jgi:hypothetical protein
VTELQFSPDGSWLMTDAGGMEVRVIHGLGTLAALMSEAKRDVTRSGLTDDERKQFSITEASQE